MATHTIHPSDTLAEIACRFDLSLSQLLAMNPQIDNPNVIVVGQLVIIPDVQVRGSGRPGAAADPCGQRQSGRPIASRS